MIIIITHLEENSVSLIVHCHQQVGRLSAKGDTVEVTILNFNYLKVLTLDSHLILM